MARALSKAERRLCEAARAGEAVVFAMQESAVVRADLIRRLILDLSVDPRPDERPLTGAGLTVTGATIDGRLDLDNAFADAGGPTPAMVFEDCIFRGGLSAEHAHLGRLSLKGCRFAYEHPSIPTINLSGAQLASDLNLQAIGPLEDGGLTWIRANSARIDGGLDLCAARLRAAPPREDRMSFEPRHVALHLGGAEIFGDIMAAGGMEALGGIHMDSCHVHGDVWLPGAVLREQDGSALKMQSAVINGNLMLSMAPDRADSVERRRFQCKGQAWLLGVRVDAVLDLSGGHFEHDGLAVVLDRARIGQLRISDHLDRTRIRGGLSAYGAKIQAGAFIRRLDIGGVENPDTPFMLNFDDLTVEGAVEFTDVRPIAKDDTRKILNAGEYLDNSILLDGAEVGGISFDSVHVNGRIQGEGLVCHGDFCFGPRLTDDVPALPGEGGASPEAAYEGLYVEISANFASLKVEGKLDLTGFTFGDGQPPDPDGTGEGRPPWLTLNDGEIDRALSLLAPPGRRRRSFRLRAARTSPLECYPGWRLLEALWWGLGPDKRRLSATSLHLVGPKDELRTMTGQPADFYGMSRLGALQLGTIEQAEHYARLFSGALRTDGAASRLITRREDLPADVRIDAEGYLRQLATADEQVEAAASAVARAEDTITRLEAQRALKAARSERSRLRRLQAFSITHLERVGLTPRLTRRKSDFLLNAVVLHDRALRRWRISISTNGTAEMLTESTVSPPLTGAFPRADGRLAIVDRAGDSSPPEWPEAPLLRDAVAIEGRELRVLGRRLTPEIVSAASLANAVVDLKDLCCATLDDASGAAWGGDVQLMLDRMTYKQAVAFESEKGAANGHGPWARFVGGLRRLVHWAAGRLRRSPALGPVLARAIGHRRWSLFDEEFKQPWERRRDWLFLQYGAAPGRDRESYIPPPEQYRPQPFAEAIRVSRAMGDEAAAIELEVLKNRIEGRHYVQRTGAFYWLAGAIAGVAALALTVAGSGDRLFPKLLIGLVSGVIVAVIVGKLAAIGDWALRIGFGYLRKPLNASLTLVGSFLIGWLGVSAAQANHRLVVDVTPVASIAFQDSEKNISIGSPLSLSRGRLNVRCSDINEPLYALDVFIPLVDLRQEERCEVGTPDPDVNAEPKPPEKPRNAHDATVEQARNFPHRPEPEKPRAEQSAMQPPDDPSVLGEIAARTVKSTRFWDFAKALYAVCGWITISLAILTFAQVARRRDEQGA